jgi:cytidylate kinase
MRVLVSDNHRELIDESAESCLVGEDNGGKVVENAAVWCWVRGKWETRMSERKREGRIAGLIEGEVQNINRNSAMHLRR